MLNRYHGEQIAAPVPGGFAPGAAAVEEGRPTVGFMFGDLADRDENRLPEGDATLGALKVLGQTMADDPSSEASVIPAAYTYFGQFIDHDITRTDFTALQGGSGKDPIKAEPLRPLKRDEVLRSVFNKLTPVLDLDSVYGGLARSDATLPDGRMKLGEVSPTKKPIPTADRFHDLPRRQKIDNPKNPDEQALDRQALIGDARNDENLLVAQLHVAILRAHNALMDRGLDGASAQREIRRRYQWAVLRDFMPRVCDPGVVEDVLANGPKAWKVYEPDGLFMPVEFAGAAYRFGHSMVRGDYSHNVNFDPTQFQFLFTFTALSGDISPNPEDPSGEFERLPDNWIIEWHRFFGTRDNPASLNPARRMDTNLTPELGNLRGIDGMPIPDIMAKLAARNLLRGYLLGLPTGQAVAAKLGVAPLPEKVLRAAVPVGAIKTVEAAGLFRRTPLWFYVLAEAGDPAGPNGQHLGPVGSRIVAETLWNVAKFSPDSVIDTPPSDAELASGEFSLKGIVKLGQDKGMQPIE